MSELRRLAPLPLAFFAAHAGFHVHAGRPEEALWTCTMANLILGVGLLGSMPTLIASAVAWLILGNLLWAVDLCSGGAFYPTSLLTHVGGLAVGVFALRVREWPRGAWWRAALLLLALQQACRGVTPRAANVNLAFDLYPGMDAFFPSYGWYWVSLVAMCCVIFGGAERWFRRDARARSLDGGAAA